jgi:hypothetical protein
VTQLPEFRHVPRLGLPHNKTRESVLKHRIAIRVGMAACVGMTALGVAGASSAQAQMVYVEPPPRMFGGPPPAAVEGGLPASEILMVVRASGLRPLTQPERRGPRYVLLASDNMGGQLRVVVSAFDGRIIHAEPAHDPRFAYHPARPRGLVPVAPPQHAAMPPPHPSPELREPTPPLPRTARTTAAPQPPAPATQGHRLTSAPDTTGSVPTRPARTPLPRPRPASAANETAAATATPAPAPQAAARETSPEAETSPAARPAPAAPSAAPATKPPAETQIVPVAPLD